MSRPSLLMDKYMVDYFMASNFKILWVGYWNKYITQFQGLPTQASLNPKMISAWINFLAGKKMTKGTAATHWLPYKMNAQSVSQLDLAKHWQCQISPA